MTLSDRIWRRPFRVERYLSPPNCTDPIIDSFVTLQDADEWAQLETEYTEISLVLERDISGDWVELYTYTIATKKDLDRDLTVHSKCRYDSDGHCTNHYI